MPLVTPLLPAKAEGYSGRTPPTGCVKAPSIGAVMFRGYVMRTLGGRDVGINRRCDTAPSHHHEGRAWDWGMDVRDRSERTRVGELLAWLLAPGPSGPHEMFRRAGIEYIIWHRRIFTASTPRWVPYDGYDAAGRCTRNKKKCADAHDQHVHFSFGWPAARGETSFYDWLRAGAPARPPVQPPRWGVGALGFALGAGAVWLVARAG